MVANLPIEGPTKREGNAFVLTREFKAPRDLVWKAFTEEERLKHWWGPKGMDWVRCSLDLRPGGLFHYCMKAPNGHVMWGRFVYREISAPERLVFVVSFSDENGGVTRHPMATNWPLEVLNTVTFSETNGMTRLHMHGIPINASEDECAAFVAGFSGMEKGFGGTLDQLEAYLKSAR